MGAKKYSLWALVFRKARCLIRLRFLISLKHLTILKSSRWWEVGTLLSIVSFLARVNDIFKVTISNVNDNRVSSLAEAIRNNHLDRFQDIDSTSLALYKVGFIADSVIINTLRQCWHLAAAKTFLAVLATANGQPRPNGQCANTAVNCRYY